MNSREIAYAKHGAFTTKSWNTFQTIIKRCLKFKERGGKRVPANSALPAAESSSQSGNRD